MHEEILGKTIGRAHSHICPHWEAVEWSHNLCPLAAQTNDEMRFEIIGHEKNWYLLQVKESLLINKLNPELNDNISSVPLYLFT